MMWKMKYGTGPEVDQETGEMLMEKDDRKEKCFHAICLRA